MSKSTPHGRSRKARRLTSRSTGWLNSLRESWLTFATLEHGKSRSNFPKLIAAFGLPLIAIVLLSLLTGPLAEVAVAQTPAAEPPQLDTGDTAWLLTSAAFVLLMTPGLAFFYGGLVRSRNVLNTMMMSLIAMGIVGVTWILWGYSLSFDVTLAEGQTFADGIQKFIGGLGWLGLNGVAFDAADPIGYAPTIPHQVFMIYQMMFAIVTVALVSGAIVERVSFKAFFWFIVLWSTFVYCPLAHMVWGRGLLGSMGALDFAGGTVVHISSGISALVAAWMIGPRRDWMVKPVIPHNVPFVLLGVGLLWFGWFGFNAGSALSAGALATVAFVATTTSASAAGLAWASAEWILKGKPTAIGVGSGFVAGLVGITPAAGFVTPVSAIAIGAITGLACYFAVNLKAKLQFDDSLDTFPIHGVGGAVGAVLTGIFATKAVNAAGNNGLLYGNPGQLVTQVVAVIIAAVFAAVLTFAILKLLSLFMDLRVSPTVEDEGLDVHEHGEGAYGEEIPGEIAFAKSAEQ
ncbi:ammonium transporter [Leptolyngbya sp. FACHB-36]|uniref:ammonium transporter n=1 Tax=Leptolyngbya sp. FACHB-36 TaxID=2692808 RepID=UPI00168073B9|nr:ammonium transporter [Leptolyngbya sp. FACHB-36]MBD2022465.1 ammonium transporter [Leptolyngbya sp. FACHB-36]